jgi:hypothetical protein
VCVCVCMCVCVCVCVFNLSEELDTLVDLVGDASTVLPNRKKKFSYFFIKYNKDINKSGTLKSFMVIIFDVSSRPPSTYLLISGTYLLISEFGLGFRVLFSSVGFGV